MKYCLMHSSTVEWDYSEGSDARERLVFGSRQREMALNRFVVLESLHCFSKTHLWNQSRLH